jgi:hypothetical protein
MMPHVMSGCITGALEYTITGQAVASADGRQGVATSGVLPKPHASTEAPTFLPSFRHCHPWQPCSCQC